MTVVTLGDLLNLTEKDAAKRNAWPKSAEQAKIGYLFAYGRLAAQVETIWQWDEPVGRTRFERRKTMEALSYMLRMYLMLRVVSAVRHTSLELEVLPLNMPWKQDDPFHALAVLADPGAMIIRPLVFMGALQALCKRTRNDYAELIYSVAK